MKGVIRIVAFLILLSLLSPRPNAGAAGPRQPDEYEVKAAFLYNFLPFVEWPSSPGRSRTLRVCLLGEPTGKAFDDLAGQEIMGRRIEIVRTASPDQLAQCDVLFIGASEQKDVPRILKALEGTSVLSIADTAGLARQGVIINFYLDRKKIRFEINAAAARRAHLIISSKLLKLAGSVYGASPGGE